MENKPKFKPDPKLKLMDQVRQVLRYHHYAYRHIAIELSGISSSIGADPSGTNGSAHIEAFLSHLATHGQVSDLTQKQALNTIIFYAVMYSASRSNISLSR